MRIPKLFHSSKTISPEVQKQDKMWELWANGQAASPYQQLMTYQAEVNNGGHAQFFFNTDNAGDTEIAVREVLRILPEMLYRNLQTAFLAYTQYRDTDETRMDQILAACDRVFYENEAEINALLKNYVDTMQI